MRKEIRRYIQENFDDLLELDMTLARLMGAPSPHTLSSYAYTRAKAGSKTAKFWKIIIDFFYGKLILQQRNHCRKDYERVTNVQSVQGTTS